jgi:hypothetical protein
MISKLQLTSLLAAFAVVALLAGSAQATVHSLSGNARFMVGDGLPIPIGFTAAPNGGITISTAAVVSQPVGADPRDLILPQSAIRFPAIAGNIGVFLLNSAVFQVNTQIGATFPTVTSTLVAGGRTGGSTVTYCVGSTVPPGGNPGCPGGAANANPTGQMIYMATGNQFGGPLQGRLFGTADVALNLNGHTQGSPVTGAIAQMALASPNATGTGGIGNPFGGRGTSSGPAPNPGRFTILSGTTSGRISGVVVTGSALPGQVNGSSGGGGPWTTGVLMVRQSAALGTPESFTLTGSDGRVSGVGTISLVAGQLSNRQFSGPNGNRGWLNLTIGPAIGALPSMSGPGIAALVGLMSLAGGYAMRKRNRK